MKAYARDYVKELEKKHQIFRLKRLLKRFCAGVLMASLGVASFFIYERFKRQDELLRLALKEKQVLSQKLELAKIKAQKQEILAQKAQESEPLQAQKPLIQINSVFLNANKLKASFYKRPNLKDALLLARIHFENKAYEKSKFWAFKANELEGSNATSWELFIKSKLALGQKERAKKALDAYISFYNPSNQNELKVLFD